MRLISEIIEQEIINKLDNTLRVESFSQVANSEQVVTFCNVKWIKLYEFAYVNGVELQVKSIDGNEVTFTITSQSINYQTLVTIKKPLFFNGTLSNTKYEWSKYLNDDGINSERSKLPFIWLVSPTDEITNGFEQGSTRTSQCKLWFIHWSDWNLLNIDRQDEAVKPLYALMDEFQRTILRNASFFKGFNSFTTRDFPKFGTESQNGIEKQIFDSTLSAVEFDVNLEIFARYCENC